MGSVRTALIRAARARPGGCVSLRVAFHASQPVADHAANRPATTAVPNETCQLAQAGHRARQEKVAKVRAGHQQHESNNPAERQECSVRRQRRISESVDAEKR